MPRLALVGWPWFVPATELLVREWGNAVDVLKYITVLLLFLFSSTPPDEPLRGKQTVVGFLNFYCF